MRSEVTDTSPALSAVTALVPDFPAEIGMVLGTGLSAVAAQVEAWAEIPYTDLPGFPVMHAPGHPGMLIIGTLWGKRVVCLCGRSHLYEGVPARSMLVPVRVLKDLGCQIMIATNACGSMEPDMPAGSIMAISDHINMTGANPLIGSNQADYGPRFVDMRDAYDHKLRKCLRQAAKKRDIELFEGVFAGVTGPSFETPSELHLLSRLGGHVVGMSTIHEVIAARHCGLRVVGLSCITNLAAGLGDEALISETLRSNTKRRAIEILPLLLEQFFQDMTDV